MGSLQIGLIFLLILWLGVAVGGNLIAAPAKFSVETVNRTDLIQVGRVQFTWIGRVEILFAVAAVILGFGLNAKPSVAGGLILAAILCLCLQRFGLHPALTEQGGAKIHIAYIVAEIIKVTALAISSFILLRS